MPARPLLMSDDPAARPHAVLPPPPSHPDDGPTALDVPPLDSPPRMQRLDLHVGSGRYSFPLRTWAVFVLLFVLGTLVTFLIER